MFCVSHEHTEHTQTYDSDGNSLGLFWIALLLFTTRFTILSLITSFSGLLWTVSIWDEINDRDVRNLENLGGDYTSHLRVVKWVTLLYITCIVYTLYTLYTIV